jgi:hypothetical protein
MESHGKYRQTDELLVDAEDCPLPLHVIPNHMGINLCSVSGIHWTRREDGQLEEVTICFLPAEVSK